VKDKLITLQSFIATRWFNKFATEGKVKKFQEKMLIKHLRFLRSNSPYFARFPAITGVDQITKLPIMDKSIMMRHFNLMNTIGLDKDTAMKIAINSEKSRDFNETYNGISVGLSSGTSGHRGVFVISDHERSAWAGAVLAKYLPKGKLFGHRIAFFLRANNNLYEAVGSALIKFKYFDVYKDMDAHIAALAEYQPTIIVAPPSVLGVIADKIVSGELSINPQKIISVAEVLPARDEKKFKKVFGTKIIFQAYQCTEGFLAHTCEAGSIHLNEDIVYVEKEFLDNQRFVPIVTDFRRTSQPIIRYRLNDILVASKTKCSCGSAMTVIDRIEGREDDIFLFKNQAGEITKVFPDMISRCLLYVKDIKEYRIVQTDYNQLIIHLDNNDIVVQKAIASELAQLARKLSFTPPKLRYEPYRLNLSRKLKRVERQFSK
jgi:putative adenylate-forming enzyme